MDEVLDIQHDTDPAHEEPPARRIPHLGHALLYFSLNIFCVLLSITIALVLVHATSEETALHHPIAAALGQLAGYVLTFALAVPLFPVFWTYSFWQGIHWNPRPARLHWIKLITLGIALSLLAQFADHFINTPSDSDILQLFRTPLSAWLTAILGTFVPAIAEEVAFRGFLLPALATAYDWLSFDRTPAGVDRWLTTNNHTLPAWIFGATFSSVAFTALHGSQIHWAHAPLAVLFAVSLAFCAIRIRYRSVAAAVVVHATYDGLIFLILAIQTGGFRHLDKLL